MCILRYTHCQTLVPPRRKYKPAKTLRRRGFFCWRSSGGQFVENVPTKRGITDENPTREG